MRNPFRFGPPASSADEFFGREQIIDEVLSLVAQGQPCSIVGERRIGKTSLLLHIAHPCSRELVKSKMGPVLVVSLDFQGHRDLTVDTFWQELVREATHQAQTQDLDEHVLVLLKELQGVDGLDIADMRRFAVELARSGARLLLLFDEFEYVADCNALDMSFFGGLRSLVASNLPVTCITASRKSLSEIDRFASGYSFVSSPFFNVFTTIRLSTFKPEEAEALLTRLLQGTRVRFSADDIKFLYELSGYHPFFLQMAAYYLFEENKRQSQAGDREKRLSAQTRFAKQCRDHFDYYWTNSIDTERAVLVAYASNQAQIAKDSNTAQRIQFETAVQSLVDRALLIPSQSRDGSYQLTSVSLANWIRETTSTETRPQTADLTPEDFKRLSRDGDQFEALVRQLLEVMGYHLLEKPAAGADSGFDILAEHVVKDAAIERRERVIVECKHYAHSGKAVGSHDIAGWRDTMTNHEASGYLLVTDTRVTENLARLFREFTEDKANYPRWAEFWDIDKLISYLSAYEVDFKDGARQNIHVAIAHLERISPDYSQWADVYQALVNAYYQLLRDGDYYRTKRTNLDAEAEARYRLGMERWRQENLQCAVGQLSEIHPQAKEFEEAQSTLAQVYVALGQQKRRDQHWQEAISWWNKALAISQGLEETLRWPIRRAKIQAWVGRYQQETALIGLLLGILAVALTVWQSWLPTPYSPSPTFCNGNFDDRFTCWEHGGELNQTAECNGNQCYAVLGNPDYSCESGVPVGEAWIRQSFEVPQEISPTLSLNYRIFSQDIYVPEWDGYDYFYVAINGEPLSERYGNFDWDESSCDIEPWDSGWQTLILDLSAYRGQVIEISFHNVNGTHPGYNTWTTVSDVKIDEAN